MLLARLVAALALTALAVVAACGSDESGDRDPAGAGSGGSGPGASGPTSGPATGSGASAGAGPGSGGTGGAAPAVCVEVLGFEPPACSECLVAQCCDLVTTCAADPACAGCLDDDDTTQCADDNATLLALSGCVFGEDSPCAEDCEQMICDSGLGLGLADAPCASCLGDNCCAEYTSCVNDEECLGCLTGVIRDEPTCSANANLGAVQSCGNDSCGQVCVTEICDSGLVHPIPACGSCLEASCCAEMTACGADAICRDCITGKTPAGDAACTGSAAFATAMDCQAASCGNEC